MAHHSPQLLYPHYDVSIKIDQSQQGEHSSIRPQVKHRSNGCGKAERTQITIPSIHFPKSTKVGLSFRL